MRADDTAEATLLFAIAAILDAGASQSAKYTFNVTDQHRADTLRAMAAKAREIAGAS